jgi:type I restriction enzyme, S subunit
MRKASTSSATANPEPAPNCAVRNCAGENQTATATSGWQTKTLEETCLFSNGLWKGETPPFVHVGVIRNTNFTKEGTLDDSDIAYLDVEAKKLEKRRLQFGDIILEKSGGGPKQPVGRVALFDKTEGDFSFSNFTAALRVRDSRELDFRFLHKYLHWTYLSGITEGMQSHSTGIRNLDGDAYKAIKITFPPLAEQQRIVGILDEAFAGIATAKANAEQNRQNARALFDSHLQAVFSQRGEGWVVKSISEVAKHSLGKMLDKAKNKGESQPYLRNINVRWFTFDLSDLLQMPFLPGETEKYTAVKGDVLICEGGYPGRAAIWSEDYPVHFQKALHRVRFYQPEHNKWFLYYLYAQDKSGELKQHFSGTGIQHFTGEVLARFTMPVPPLPELRRFVAKIDALSAETQRLEAIYQRKLATLEALKKSLLHQAFTGGL